MTVKDVIEFFKSIPKDKSVVVKESFDPKDGAKVITIKIY